MLVNFNNKLSDTLICVGKKCKEKRKENKLTQLDLAFYAEIETSTVSKIERFSVENVSLKTLLKIAIVLKTDLVDFL